MGGNERVWFLYDKREVNPDIWMFLVAIPREVADELAEIRRRQEHEERKLVVRYPDKHISRDNSLDFEREFERVVEPLAKEYGSRIQSIIGREDVSTDMIVAPRNFGMAYREGDYFPHNYLERALDIYARTRGCSALREESEF